MKSETPYQKVQIGYGILFMVLIAETSMIIGCLRFGNPMPSIFFSLLLAFLSVCFYSLQVTVDEAWLRLKFGIGLIHKEIGLDQIQACSRVKKFPLSGWGLKRIGRTRGWSYSVSGFEAVELKLKSGQILRIGTHDPDGLLQTLQERIK